MTNTTIFDKIGITVQIDGEAAPSRKEQRAAAKSELEGIAPANMAELYEALKSKGFGVNFGVSLYKKGGEFASPEAEAAYIHAKVLFGYIQTLAIRYKAAAIFAEAEGKKSEAYKAMIEARSALYEGIKAFCAEDEADITRKCKAADAESISTYAAKFTFKGEFITEGVKYTRNSLTAFAMAFMRYLAADEEGIEASCIAVQNGLARLQKKAK